ncbi:MerR family transcriptional regulator, partial [Enterococcus faecium]|uniref:MerR family transcriptional regulator n=2 Tax=Enterococcus TaxID=1350 RepID=UPI0025798245
MKKEKKLLSIGEISKITLISIRALRYYDEKNIFKPAHIDKETGYRYYEVSQIPELAYVKIATELGIPLKEILKFYDYNLSRSFSYLMNQAEEIALKKREEIDKQLQFINRMKVDIENKNLSMGTGKTVISNHDERHFYCLPFEQIASDFDFQKKLSIVLSKATSENFSLFSEWGILHYYDNTSFTQYIYIEVYISDIP